MMYVFAAVVKVFQNRNGCCLVGVYKSLASLEMIRARLMECMKW